MLIISHFMVRKAKKRKLFLTQNKDKKVIIFVSFFPPERQFSFHLAHRLLLFLETIKVGGVRLASNAFSSFALLLQIETKVAPSQVRLSEAHFHFFSLSFSRLI